MLKIRRFLSTLSIASLLAVYMVFVPSAQPPASAITNADGECELYGGGTTADPYLIADALQLREISDCSSAAYFELVSDILLQSPWDPIPMFEGSFDGNNHTIVGLDITSTGREVGMFGSANGASFSNVSFSSATVVANTASPLAGVLVGAAFETNFENILVSDSTVTSASIAGGIAGQSWASPDFSYLVVRESEITGGSTVGGLIGEVGVNRPVFNATRNLVTRSIITGKDGGLDSGGGLYGAILTASTSEVNIFESGFDGELIGDPLGGTQSGNISKLGGLIGRADVIDPAAQPGDLNIRAVGARGSFTDENSSYFAGLANGVFDMNVEVEIGYNSFTTTDGSAQVTFHPFAQLNGNSSLDVVRSFVDSTKQTTYVGDPLPAGQSYTTAELRTAAPYLANQFFIEDDLQEIYSGRVSEGGFIDLLNDGSYINDGFLAFAWAKDHYGPGVFITEPVANGNLLPAPVFSGLDSNTTYEVTVHVFADNSNSYGTPVPLFYSSDIAKGDIYFAGAQIDSTAIAGATSWTDLEFRGTPAELDSMMWRIFPDPATIAGKSDLKISLALSAGGPTIASVTEIVPILSCDLESEVNIGSTAAGTADDPFLVQSVDDLPVIGQCMGPNKHFKLTSSLDLSNVNHTPIGHDLFKFSGVFDGDGRTISNLYLNKPMREDQGFFGEFGDSLSEPATPIAEIKNLAISGEVVGDLRAAVLAGDTDSGSFANIQVSGSVSARLTAGLLTGDAENLYVSDTLLEGEVTVASEEAGLLAGDVADTFLEVRNVTARGAVIGETAAIGGLVGYIDSDYEGSVISDSTVFVDVLSRPLFSYTADTADVGGLVGESYDMEYSAISVFSLERAGMPDGRVFSAATPGVDRDSNNFGGVIGGSHGDVVSGVETYLDVIIDQANVGDDETGGLIGEIEGSTVSYSTSYGDVYGYYEVGGLIGEMDDPDGTKIVEHSQAHGDVTGNERVGGLVGHAETSSSTSDEYIEITNNVATGTVLGYGSNQLHFGGLVGRVRSYNDGLVVSGNRFEGTLVKSDGDEVGGLVGRVYLDSGTAEFGDNTVTGRVEGLNDVGGIFGAFDANFGVTSSQITQNSFTGVVAATGDNVGGLAGWIDISGGIGSILANAIEAQVSGVDWVGGAIGSLEVQPSSLGASLSETSFVGSVAGDDDVAAHVGIVDVVGSTLDVLRLTTDADVTADNSVGGLIGELFANGGVVTLTDVIAEGSVHANYNHGGLVGLVNLTNADLTISEATSSSVITAGIGDDVGGLIGELFADGGVVTLTDVSASGSVDARFNIGGLIGLVTAVDTEITISEAAASGAVTAPAGGDTGGFIGEIYAEDDSLVTVISSYATGDVDSEDWAGGFIAYFDLRDEDTSVVISDSYATGRIISHADFAGGFTAGASADRGAQLKFVRSYATGNVSATEDKAGGFIGSTETYDSGTLIEFDQTYASGSVTGSYDVGGFAGRIREDLDSQVLISESAAFGDVSATSDDAYVGGFIGVGWGTISDSYATGSVTGNNFVGGFLGYLEDDVTSVSLNRVYSAGTVTGSGAKVGGFAGEVEDAGYTTEAYFYSATISSGLAHSDSVADEQATALSLAELRSAETFAEWDIADGYDLSETTTWVSCPGFSPNGPALRWIMEQFEVSTCAIAAGVPAPYLGPIVTHIVDPTTKLTLNSVEPGQEVTFVGSKLDGVSAITIDGHEVEIQGSNSGEITGVIPEAVTPGVYDLDLESSTGALSVQRFVRVVADGTGLDTAFSAWTSLKGDYVKVYAKNVVNQGKVQFFVNGREVAWVRAADATNPKLRQARGFVYLVRSVYLKPGKNVFEIYLDDERFHRAAYTLRD